MSADARSYNQFCYAFTFEDNGRYWVTVVSPAIKTLGPYKTWDEAQKIARAFN